MNNINNNLEMRTLDGKVIPDESDWERIEAMTDDEAVQAALEDLDAQPMQEGAHYKRLDQLAGNSLIEKLRSVKKENKQLLSIRYNCDIIDFFKSKGEGYQSLMNKVLREYMNRELQKQS